MPISSHFTLNKTLAIKASIIFISIAAAISITSKLVREVRHYQTYSKPSSTAAYELRYDELKHMLPPQGVLGYLSDQPDPGLMTRDMMLTQYVLSPRIIVRGKNHPVIIGDFSSQYSGSVSQAYPDLVIVKKWDTGVVLFSGGNP